MAYQIDRYNGTFLISIDDQTINSTATDLRLVGRNYSGYGEIQNENLLHLLENFANTSPPPRAILGQLWYDSVSKKISVYDGSKFKPVGGAQSAANAPSGFATGDFWWDNQNEQINVWNGTEFILVGPEKSPIYGDTSTAPAVVIDTTGTEQQIIKFQVGGEVIAIVARSSFTLNAGLNPITGFNILQPGINFINSDPTTGETSSVHRFIGTASNAQRLGGFAVTDFLRSSNTSFTSQVNFKDSGFTLGDQTDLRIRVLNGNSPTIESTGNQPIIVRLSDNEGDIKDIAVIKATGIEPGSTGLYDLGSTSAKWKTLHSEEVKATTFYGKLVGTVETAPGPGGVTQPLSIQSITVGGAFNMTSGGGVAGSSNFNVDLVGSTSAVTIASGTVGSLNNFNIGLTTPGVARVTMLAVTGDATVSSSLTVGSQVTVAGNVNTSGTLSVANNVFMNGTGAVKVPSGLTAQRPVSPVTGMIRFNTSVGEWEGFDGSEWRFIGGDADQDYGLITGEEDVFVDYGALF
jgi:hypothetical protein